ncbi:MAG: hypothetical protein K0R38_3440 [Polyangiaceae bacterium]|jgi:hypothetical protein|nr:hypothetical protein [Polyangiaceae bacterium]
MSSLRHVLALALVSSAVLLGGAPACSQQTEGERCDSAKAGDSDCESGLTCVSSNGLIEGLTDRCCPEAGTETDKRCTRGTATPPATGGSGGTAGTSSGGSTSGAGGTSSGGSTSAEAGAAGTPAEAIAGAGGAD